MQHAVRVVVEGGRRAERVGRRDQLTVAVPLQARHHPVGVDDLDRQAAVVERLRRHGPVGPDHARRRHVIGEVLEARHRAGSVDVLDQAVAVVPAPALRQPVGIGALDQVVAVVAVAHGGPVVLGDAHHPPLVVVGEVHRRAVDVEDRRQVAEAVVTHPLHHPSGVGEHRQPRLLVLVRRHPPERAGLADHLVVVAVVLVDEGGNAVGVDHRDQQVVVPDVLDRAGHADDALQHPVVVALVLDGSAVVADQPLDQAVAAPDRSRAIAR